MRECIAGLLVVDPLQPAREPERPLPVRALALSHHRGELQATEHSLTRRAIQPGREDVALVYHKRYPGYDKDE